MKAVFLPDPNKSPSSDEDAQVVQGAKERSTSVSVLVQTLRQLEWTVIMVLDERVGFVQGTALFFACVGI